MIKVGMNLLLWSDDTHFDQHKWLLEFCKEIASTAWNLTGITNSFDECHKFGDYAAAGAGSHHRGCLIPKYATPSAWISLRGRLP